MSDRQRTVLIFRIGSMGDTLVALPSFRHIRAQEPEARIILLTNAPIDGGLKAASSVHILEHLALVDEYIEYRSASRMAALLSLARALRGLKVSRCFYLMPPRTLTQRIRDRAFLWFGGIGRVSGLSLMGRRQQNRLNNSVGLFESEAARLLRMIGGHAASLATLDFSLQITLLERERSKEALKSANVAGRYIVISIGTKAAANDWGHQSWMNLVRRLEIEYPGIAFVFIGSADEGARCHAMGSTLDGAWANFCGRLSVRDSASMIAGADLFIGHDSGPMHLANAVDTPLVAIFSARNPRGIWFPVGQEQSVIYHEVNCAGCGLQVCIEQGMRCIRSISVDEVIDRIKLRLALSRDAAKK